MRREGTDAFGKLLIVYDIMGRVNQAAECLPGQCSGDFNAVRSYTYDQASNLLTEKYSTQLDGGFPATLTYTYNTAVTGPPSSFGYEEFGRLKSVSSAGNSFGMNFVLRLVGKSLAAEHHRRQRTAASVQLQHQQQSGKRHAYDAAGNVSNDGSHSYTYEA